MTAEWILDTAASRLFANHVTRDLRAQAEAGVWPDALWTALEEAGLTHPALIEAAGGAGGDLIDEATVLTAFGRAAAPAPLPETILAGWLLATAGLAVPRGPLSLAPVIGEDHLTLTRRNDDWQLSGRATRIPWAGAVNGLALLAETGPGAYAIAWIDRAAYQMQPGKNMAGEPRDDINFAEVTVPANAVAEVFLTPEDLRRRGALVRATVMAGALAQVLDLTVRYAGERKQFGRPIGKFQAVQQQLAVLAGQAAVASRAARGAYETLARRENADFAIAVAKARVSEAAGVAASIAHQVHGAIGFTHEHELHYSTRRLWSWRDEFGGESYWQAWVGQRAAALGADALWPLLTETLDDQSAPEPSC